MRISDEEVRKTAALARLALSDEEVARMTREFDAILTYMEKLAELDVSSVPPMTHAMAAMTPLREDVVAPSLSPDESLSGAPRRRDGCFEVPRIIAGEES